MSDMSPAKGEEGQSEEAQRTLLQRHVSAWVCRWNPPPPARRSSSRRGHSHRGRPPERGRPLFGRQEDVGVPPRSSVCLLPAAVPVGGHRRPTARPGSGKTTRCRPLHPPGRRADGLPIARRTSKMAQRPGLRVTGGGPSALRSSQDSSDRCRGCGLVSGWTLPACSRASCRLVARARNGLVSRGSNCAPSWTECDESRRKAVPPGRGWVSLRDCWTARASSAG